MRKKLLSLVILSSIILSSCNGNKLTDAMYDFSYLEKIFEDHKGDNNNITEKLLQRRKLLTDKYLRVDDFIETIEKKEHFFSTFSRKEETFEYKVPFFFNFSDIVKAIDIKRDDKDSAKARKIFDFVYKNFKSAPSFYREGTKDYLSPQIFLNSVGFGYCGIANYLIITLAKYFGLNAKSYNINGHVLCAIYHDDDWRIYDAYPDGIGLVINQYDKVVTIDQLVYLAEDKQLDKFNEEIASTENNFLQDITKLENFKDPMIHMNSRREIKFYDGLYIFGLDHYSNQLLNREKNRYYTQKEFLDLYSPLINNFTVETIIDKAIVKQDRLTIEEPYQINSLIIQIPKSNHREGMQYPEIYTNFSHFHWKKQGNKEGGRKKLVQLFIKNEQYPHIWYSPKVIKGKGKYDYLDYTYGVNKFDSYSNHKITLRNMDKFLKEIKQAKVITVHTYAKERMKMKV